VVATSVGYAGLGCGAGYVAASEAIRAAENRGERTPLGGIGGLGVTLGTLAGCGLGLRIGLNLGREADSLLARGEALSPGRRHGVQLGTVLAGATLGTLLSFFPVSRQDGRNAEIIAIWALAGAALGGILQLAWNRHLYPRRTTPTLQLVIDPGPVPWLGIRMRF
jgi:hypothetical protein